jgi:4-hydroxy-tetrahydrodipicolinate synthase
MEDRMNLRGVGGVWPAALTPFEPGGAIDDGALSVHLAHLAGTPGVNAVVVNGHAGEVTSLDRAERMHVVEMARRVAGPAVGVVTGVIADDTRGARQFARDAESAGADAVLLFPPALFASGARLRPEMARAFVGEVAEATTLPLVLFQLAVSGLGYTRDTLVSICDEVRSVIAVKEGSDDPVAYETNLRALRALSRHVTVLTTNNAWLLSSLAVGGDGILSGMGSVTADVHVDLYRAVRAGDLDAARRANDRLFPLTQVFYRPPFLDMHNRMKTALHLLGRLPHPAVRPPLLPLPSEEVATIAAALAAAGLEPRPAAGIRG